MSFDGIVYLFNPVHPDLVTHVTEKTIKEMTRILVSNTLSEIAESIAQGDPTLASIIMCASGVCTAGDDQIDDLSRVVCAWIEETGLPGLEAEKQRLLNRVASN